MEAPQEGLGVVVKGGAAAAHRAVSSCPLFHGVPPAVDADKGCPFPSPQRVLDAAVEQVGKDGVWDPDDDPDALRAGVVLALRMGDQTALELLVVAARKKLSLEELQEAFVPHWRCWLRKLPKLDARHAEAARFLVACLDGSTHEDPLDGAHMWCAPLRSAPLRCATQPIIRSVLPPPPPTQRELPTF